MSKVKSGAITNEENRQLLSHAEKLLKQIKNNPKERSKVPYRLDSKTVILVSKKKYKELKKNEAQTI